MKVNEIQYANLSEIKSASVSNSKDKVKDNFDSYLNKTYSYEEIINIASQAYNVPSDLIKSVIMMESSFDPNSTSYCGAMGLMQLMPVAAKEVGVSDAYDPVQNIMGGTKLLSQFLKKYDGDISLTLAAYNGGPGNVKKYNGVPPFCQKYVEKVTGFMKNGVQVPKEYVTVNLDSNTTTPVKTYESSNSFNQTGEIKPSMRDKYNYSDANKTPNANDIEEINDNDDISILTSSLNFQMLEAFKHYNDYMRVLDLLDSSED